MRLVLFLHYFDPIVDGVGLSSGTRCLVHEIAELMSSNPLDYYVEYADYCRIARIPISGQNSSRRF